MTLFTNLGCDKDNEKVSHLFVHLENVTIHLVWITCLLFFINQEKGGRVLELFRDQLYCHHVSNIFERVFTWS